MTNSITNRQLFYILIMTITTYTTIDLPKMMAEKVGRSSWILVLGMAVLFSGAAILVTKLNNRFAGKVMFDYSREIVGTVASRVIVIYYILYFVLVGVYLKIKLVEFVTANFLPKTPQFILLAFSVALFGFVAYKGVTNVARMFQMFGTIFLVTTILVCGIMLFQGMLYNIRPFYDPNEIKQIPSALPSMLFPFGGIEVLLIIPFTQKNRKAPLVAFLTMIFIGFLYVQVVEGTICILGINNTMLYNDALIEAIKIVFVPVIERTDIFYLTVGLTSLFAGMIMVFLCSLEYTCRLFHKVERKIITPIVALALYVLCIFGLGVKDINHKLDAYAPYLVSISSFGIPGFLMLVAVIRKKKSVHEPEDEA